jgi:hypothetical protein
VRVGIDGIRSPAGPWDIDEPALPLALDRQWGVACQGDARGRNPS